MFLLQMLSFAEKEFHVYFLKQNLISREDQIVPQTLSNNLQIAVGLPIR